MIGERAHVHLLYISESGILVPTLAGISIHYENKQHIRIPEESSSSLVYAYLNSQIAHLKMANENFKFIMSCAIS